ncbi:ABC transporter substrate-binding protein [Rheinheimera sp. YQF-2]|jgi:phospholipid transport system substrate-binding protein|uniref:ABC transporter substrate-binding protein n=1 Tax=Rheinheimera lutimaris TaxID=2740584 RepID=A0A7Y5ARU0_9GAMM|nr:ABC transporter substrate-binding protein [Rheinheimera lutimaris]NRQ43376.1 ABC transporter substrate-binding protein [Rheinheimera lutimaris]
MKLYALILAASLTMLSTATEVLAEAQTYTDPYKMMEVVADNTFSRIAKDQSKIEADPEVLRLIVNEELVPYIDSRYAALRVIGNSADLRNTPREDLLAFVDAFQNYMVATYAGVFTQYRNQQVMIEPARAIDNQKIISIKTRVIDPGKPDINIEFKLRRGKDSDTWLVFDMVAEGISLLDSKRAELSNLIRQQGLQSVTTLLTEKAKAPITRPEEK